MSRITYHIFGQFDGITILATGRKGEKMNQLTKEEALKLSESKFWESMTEDKRVIVTIL
jgi:hypothetical protein